jgi:hypothetical protein
VGGDEGGVRSEERTRAEARGERLEVTDAMQKAGCKRQNPKLEARMTIEARNPNGGEDAMQKAKCKMQNAK